MLEISFYISVPKSTIIRGTVPEIRSKTNRSFSHSEPEKSKFWKNEKKAWRYYHFTLAYHKWWSYDVWFLIYGAQQTEFFGILDYFFGLLPPLTTQKIKILQKWTFHTIVPLMTIIWYMIPEIWSTTDRIFVSLGQFLQFYPTNPKNQKFQKNENTWRYHHFKHVHQKRQSYEVQFLRYGVR